MQRKFFITALFISVLLLHSVSFVFAQVTSTQNNSQNVEGASSLGVAQMVQVKEKTVQDGSIVAQAPGGAILDKVPYDSQVLGVVSRNAAITLSTTGAGIPVVSTGIVYMLVSTQQGKIKKGDLLTTSTIPGVGVKVTNSGYVLGTAMEDYNNPDPKKIGTIAVNLDLHYFNSKPTFAGTLSDILKIALFPTDQGPAPIFKYIVAAFVVLGSFALGFVTFARTAAKGVEALGRNPSASSTIHLGIIFNVSIVVMIILAGLTVAFLILRL